MGYAQSSNAVGNGERVPHTSCYLFMVLIPCQGFFATGDFVFGGFLEDIESFLDDGIKVALINGDRDFRCNCKFPNAVFEFFQEKLTQFRGWG